MKIQPKNNNQELKPFSNNKGKRLLKTTNVQQTNSPKDLNFIEKISTKVLFTFFLILAIFIGFAALSDYFSLNKLFFFSGNLFP